VNDVTRTWTLNGERRTLTFPPLRRLLDVLRAGCGLTGTKEGCGEGECGACTVVLNGEAVPSCLVVAGQIPDGATILTIEGLERAAGGPELQQAYLENGAVQCGFCIPGMLLSSFALLQRTASPDDDQIRRPLAGNICRCTGYAKIIDAVRCAAERRPRHGNEGDR